jgi:hypothetical protein
MYNKYNWQDLEKESGKTLEQVYAETKSLRKTGEFFGKAAKVYMLTGNTVKAELLRRNIKLNGKGGSRERPWIKAEEYRNRILSLPGYQNLKQSEILYNTGLKVWQFSHAYWYKPFQYKFVPKPRRRREINHKP